MSKIVPLPIRYTNSGIQAIEKGLKYNLSYNSNIGSITSDFGKVNSFDEIDIVNKSELVIIPEHTGPKNLNTLLGVGEKPADIEYIVQIITNTIKAGLINNLVLGDWITPASIGFSAVSGSEGIANLSSSNKIDGYSSTDFILVGIDFLYSYYGTNANLVAFQSRNILASFDDIVSSFIRYNGNDYNSCTLRTHITNKVTSALYAAGFSSSLDIAAIRKFCNYNGGTNLLNDKVCIPTEYEMFGKYINSSTVENQQGILEYYNSNAKRIKKWYNSDTGKTSASHYHLMSIYKTTTSLQKLVVDAQGNSSVQDNTAFSGMAPFLVFGDLRI